MAAKFGEIDSKKSDVHSFYPEDLKIPAHLNGRHDLPDIDWLIVSILENGQIQNCTIRKDGNQPCLGIGFSRWRAVSEINKMVEDEAKRDKWIKAHTSPRVAEIHAEIEELQTASKVLKKEADEDWLAKNRAKIEALENELQSIPLPEIPPEKMRLKCEFKQWNEQEMFIANIHENLHRKPTTQLDDCFNVKTLSKWGKTDAEIGAIYGRSVTWAKNCLTIVSAEPEVLKACKQGRMKLNAVKAIAKLTSDQQKAKVAGEGKIKIEPKKEKEDKTVKNKNFYAAIERWKTATKHEEVQNLLEMILGFHCGDCGENDVIKAIGDI